MLHFRFPLFWSSVDLTGNQTKRKDGKGWTLFWSSVDLTGNQTYSHRDNGFLSFGAVSI